MGLTLTNIACDQDWANPLVRPHIRTHVEVSDTLSEFYQAERLHGADIDSLQLMWADFKHAPGRHYYIKEVAELTDGSFVIPMKWVCVLDEQGRETECADVHEVSFDSEVSNYKGTVQRITNRKRQTERWNMNEHTVKRIQTAQLKRSYPELCNNGYQFALGGMLWLLRRVLILYSQVFIR